MKEKKLVELSMDFAIKIIKICETIKGHYSLINRKQSISTMKTNGNIFVHTTMCYLQCGNLLEGLSENPFLKI